MKKASLLFDIDNTLVDRDAAFRAYIQNFIARNLPAFSGESLALAHTEIMVLDCHGRKNRQVFCRELLQRFPGLCHTEDSLWADHLSLPDFVQPDNAVNAMLERLAADYQLMAISNGSASMQRRKIQRAGLADFFEHTLISDEVGYEKPDHRLFSHAQALCKHATVVMVGDDYANDMRPAMAMQWKTVHITAEKTSNAARPDAELASIHALEEALTCMI